MEKGKILCIDCKKYFPDMKSFNEEHSKPLIIVLKKPHSFFKDGNTLEYIYKLNEANSLLLKEIKRQQNQIYELSKNVELITDLNKDIFFECNINIKNGKIIVKNIGKCLLNFFPKCINFRIECKGDIINNDKNKFAIDIIYPFRKTNIKQCFIEKIQGCTSTQEITDQDGNTFIIFDNYTSYVEQNDFLISVKLLKNYGIQGKFEQKKINVIINGMLSFNSLLVNYDIPVIIFNTLEKKFLCYSNEKWKFVDNFALENGKINDECLISLLIDNKDENNEKLYIKSQYKYLGYKDNYVTNNKNEAELDIKFYNRAFGLIEINKGENSLSMDNNGFVAFNNMKTLYIICNI